MKKGNDLLSADYIISLSPWLKKTGCMFALL